MSTCTGTENELDHRGNANQEPVLEKVITYACVSADTTATATIAFNGLLQKIIYKSPNTTNNDLTATVTIADSQDNTIFTSAAGIAENTTTIYNVTEPLVGPVDVLITFNEAVGVSATFYITLRGV